MSLLSVEGLGISFGGLRAVDDVSFSVNPGEIVSVIGPNGAGKTTFMDIVTGKTRPDEGQVRWGEFSRSLLRLTEAQIAREGIGRKFQRPTVFEDQTVAGNLTMALKAPRGPFAALIWRATAASDAKVQALAEDVGLGAQLTRKAGELSHGQKQWLEIGMLLAQDPKLLLVDEPVAGMTDAETEATAELLKEIAKDHSVIVVEHDMAFVRALDCKVTVLHEGAVLAEGALDTVSADQRVIEVYLGR